MQIEGYSDYEFYEDGTIYSYKSDRWIVPALDSHGYLKTTLIDDNGNRKTHSLNNWICRAFHGDPPFVGAEAMHLNENRFDCSAENLKWGSHIENINYGSRTEKNAQAHNKQICQYDKEGNLIATFSSIKEASIITNTSYTGIIKCAKGVIKSSGGYIWHYI